MRARVLIDNISKSDLDAEWGLSLYIEYENYKILLDAGASDAFIENAKRMGVKLVDVDFCVLSHAHYDHADGLSAFFAENANAKCYVRGRLRENCYGKKDGRLRYIGVQKGLSKRYTDRFVSVKGDYRIADGVYLIPHSSDALGKIGKRSELYVKRGLRMVADDFRHEHSLVLDSKNGLIIFNSCSHAGADNIIREIERSFPNRRILALIGGLHLYKLSDDEVRAFAQRVRETGIAALYTGHCTGERAFGLLREELGDAARQFYSGMEINI